MKIKIMSLLIPMMLIASTANSIEIYNRDGNKLDFFGKVNGMHYFSYDDRATNDQTNMIIDFKGETQINDQVVGYGRWEYQIQSSGFENSIPRTKTAIAGLKFNDVSSFDYGRNYRIIYDVTSWTSVLPEFNGFNYGAGNFVKSYANGLATYRNKNFFGLIDGLNFALQYQTKNNNLRKDYSLSKQNGSGYGASLSYELSKGLSIGSAISSSKYVRDQDNTKSNLAKVYSSGLKYDAENIYLAAQYSRAYKTVPFGNYNNTNLTSSWYGFIDKSQNLELVAQYKLDFGLRPSIAYLQAKGKGITDFVGNQNLFKYIDVGATYIFNKNMSTYLDYKISLLDDSKFTKQANICTDDILSLGLVYKF